MLILTLLGILFFALGWVLKWWFLLIAFAFSVISIYFAKNDDSDIYLIINIVLFLFTIITLVEMLFGLTAMVGIN